MDESQITMLNERSQTKKQHVFYDSIYIKLQTTEMQTVLQEVIPLG